MFKIDDSYSGIDNFIFLFKKYYLLILATLILSVPLGFYLKNLLSSENDNTYKFEFFVLQQYQNQYYEYEYTLDAIRSLNLNFNPNFGYKENYEKVLSKFSHRNYLNSILNLITQEELNKFSIKNENFNKFKDSAFMVTDSISNGFKVSITSNVLISKNFINETIVSKLIFNSIDPIKKYIKNKFNNLIIEIDKIIVLEERVQSSIAKKIQNEIEIQVISDNKKQKERLLKIQKEIEIKELRDKQKLKEQLQNKNKKLNARRLFPQIKTPEDCLKYEDICIYILNNDINIDEVTNDIDILINEDQNNILKDENQKNTLVNENQESIKIIADINEKIDLMNKCIYEKDINYCRDMISISSLSDLNKIQVNNDRIDQLERLKTKLFNFVDIEPIIYSDKIKLNISKKFRAPIEFILPFFTTLLMIIILSLYEFLIANRAIRNNKNIK